MPAIVTSCRPTCWKCGETSQFSFSFQEKKVSVVMSLADPNPLLVESVIPVSPVVGLPTARTGMVKSIS